MTTNTKNLFHLDPLKKIRQIYRFAQRHSAAIERQCGVNGGQLWLMSELLESPGLRVGELVEKLAAHQTTISNLVDDLVERGFVEKMSYEKDKRVTLLALTEAGKKILENAPKPTRGVLPHALSQIDEDVVKDLNDSLQKLIDKMEGIDKELALQLLPYNLKEKIISFFITTHCFTSILDATVF